MNILNPNEHITDHFTVREAIWLPSWERLATESDGLTRAVQHNLLTTFHKLDIIRKYFNRPIIVHCAYRPHKYNKEIGGAERSSHVEGKAVDFHVKNLPCDIVRLVIHPKLEEWGLRLEWNPGSNCLYGCLHSNHLIE